MRSTPSLRIVSSFLAVALAAAPTHVALAAAPTEDADATAEPANGDDAAEPADGDDEAEPADGEGEGGEGEEEGEGEDGESEDEEPEPADEGEDAEPEPADEQSAEPDVFEPEDERPEEPRIAGKPRTGKGMMIAGGTVLGVGIVSTTVFGLVSRHCSYHGPLQCRHRNDADFLIPLGASVTLLGAMMLAVGIGYHFQYKKWQRWTPGQDDRKKRGRRRAQAAVLPALGPDGAGLNIAGRF